MKKAILSAILLLFCAVLSAQKIEFDELDPFTKERKISTSWVSIGRASLVSPSLSIRFIYLGHKTYLGLKFEYAGTNSLTIQKDYKLMVRMNDGKIAEFKSVQREVSSASSYSNLGNDSISQNCCNTTSFLIYPYYEGDISILSGGVIPQIFRIQTSERIIQNYIDLKVSKFKEAQVQKQLQKAYELLMTAIKNNQPVLDVKSNTSFLD